VLRRSRCVVPVATEPSGSIEPGGLCENEEVVASRVLWKRDCESINAFSKVGVERCDGDVVDFEGKCSWCL
jgi:hypothetical protein